MRSLIPVFTVFLIGASYSLNVVSSEWSGSFKHESAFATQSVANDNRLIKSENLIQVETSGDLSSLEYLVDARYRHDFKDQLDSQRNELQFREAFIEYRWDSASLRLGKQTIVWGQADGIRLLDIINPINFREFVLDEYDNSRIARTALTAIVPLGRGSELTASIITEHASNDYPDAENRFGMVMTFPATPGSPIIIDTLEEPDQSLHESDFAVKYATFAGSWDVSVNIYRHYIADPRIQIIPMPEFIRVSRDFERNTLIGGSANNAFGDFVFRSELVYNMVQYYQTRNPESYFSDKSPDLQYVLGLDYSGLSDNLISAQWFQWRTLKYQNSFVDNKIKNTLTLLWRQFYLNNALSTEVLHIQELNESQDGLLRASVEYELEDNILIQSGIDIFFGSTDGIYGQFNRNDQVTFGIEVGF